MSRNVPAGLHVLRPQPVYFSVTVIADDKALLTVKQANPLSHVLQHGSELGRLGIACRECACIRLDQDRQRGMLVEAAIRPRKLCKVVGEERLQCWRRGRVRNAPVISQATYR